MKYKGLIYHAAKDFTMESCEMPECGENDVILKNVVASVCGSDADTWLNGGEMHYFPKDVEFGHEVACEVFQVGKKVKDIQVGDRVAPYPICTTPNSRKAGFLGGFSEYIYCTNASYDYNLFKLPENVSYEEAALVEPMTVGLRASDVVPVSEKTVALILGAGFVGFATAVGLVERGVLRENITFVDQSDLRLGLVAKEGFRTVSTNLGNWKEEACRQTGSSYCVYGSGSAADYIFDCAGSIHPEKDEPTLMEQAMKLLKYNGKMIAVGVHRRQVHINMQKLVFGLQHIVCGSGATKQYFEEAIRVLSEKRFDFEGKITKAYPHEEARQAIIDACDVYHYMKNVVDYRK